jgi:hypothetical protein
MPVGSSKAISRLPQGQNKRGPKSLGRAKRIHSAESRKEHVMQTDKIHRRSNGTIDIDAYRKEASALRTQTLTQMFKRLGRVWHNVYVERR